MFAQIDAPLKSQYDSIITLDANRRDELVADFFTKNKHHSDQLELALCYHEYSKKMFRNDIDKAITYAKQAITIRSKYQDISAASKSLYALGHYYNVKGNYPKSIQTYSRIVDFSKENNLTAKVHNRKGVMFTLIGDFDKAKVNFEKAERYFKKEAKTKLLYKNHIDIAQMYEKMHWIGEERMYHIDQADSIQNLIEISDLGRLILYQISGNFYDERQEYHKAIDYHKKALSISYRIQDSSYISMNYSNLGMSYCSLNNFEEAKKSYDKALLYSGNNTVIKAPVYNNLGDYYLAKCQFKKALFYYYKAIQYEEIGDVEDKN